MPRPSLVPQVTALILDQIRDRRLTPGQHLPSQALADGFRLSRAPVTAALKELERQGVVRSEPNRGYFLADEAEAIARSGRPSLGAPEAEDEVYLRIAEDRLAGRLPDRVSEAEMMRLYAVARPRLAKILYRIAEEGWAERLPGNGWEFSPMLTSREAYEHSYQFRAAVESEALRAPTFRIDAAAFAAARAEQSFILEGGHRTLSRAELFRANAAFHEMLVGCSGNDFFLEALKRVNRLRRLIEYRVTLDRSRLPLQSREHLMILDLLTSGQREAAAVYLRQHVLGASAIKAPRVG
ncbi:hypothetical protein OPKNFCMD_4551 [Methylobacterium crusticola]|uniref:HTH gntR-type domain-containing protein n=1 Tax=Methylobacterium crusticola TaxID=1697972 RepID=A0ABQ4R296_9HYPH|nr:GntR family transcriptional regulator [Methylobacterium crusticola]GJD51792.1 hypothetical protein OPKNFCMD_4551 [Methylobacterium crusticola]